jgi:hypothetical protein
VTAPVIYQAPAGTSVQIWLDRSGEPEAPPPSPEVMILLAWPVGIIATACATVVLILCYTISSATPSADRLLTGTVSPDGKSAWAAVGPRWTSHG